MSANPYDYTDRQGLHPISWEDFHGLCKGLVVAIAPYNPEIILPIGRGGYYAGALIAHLLRAEIYPIRLSRRVRDIVTHRQPQWMLEPPKLVEGRRILIVDEISSTGETINVVKEKVASLGAASIRSAVLYAHTRGVSVPDYIGIISDELILNPWDREIWQDGMFLFNPEYVQALNQQGWEADARLLIKANIIKPAKG